MRFQTRLKPSYTLIDLTPLVDVIFLLLIFFFITSDTLPLKSLLIEHPRLSSTESAKLSQLVVIMDKDQVIYVGSKKEIVDLASLKDTLIHHVAAWKEAHQNVTPTIVLSVDKRIDYETFLKIFAEATKASSKIRLAFKTTSSLEELEPSDSLEED